MAVKSGLFLPINGLLSVLLLSLPGMAQVVAPEAPALITESVNTQKLVTLAGNVHPAVTSVNDRGEVDPSLKMHLMLQLKRSAEQQQALDSYTEQLSNSKSPNYRKWLTGREFGEKFGLAQEDISAVSDWLESSGLKVEGLTAGRNVISFSGSADKVEAAFHTRIHRLSVGGKMHFSNVSEPRIPSAIAAAVRGVVKMNDFLPTPAHTDVQAHPANAASSPVDVAADPANSVGIGRYVGAQDLHQIYNFKPAFQAGYTGRGQTIVLLERSNLFSSSDWAQFRKQFGLTRPYAYGTYTEVHPAGPMPCLDPGDNTDDFEATLDAEWASAAAPNAAIVLASCQDVGVQIGPLVALVNLLNGPTAPPAIMSLSYQGSEDQQGATENAFLRDLYQQAAVEGVSLFVASGDSGADSDTIDRANNVATQGITVNALASTPFNVAVGGTDFSDTYYNSVNKYWLTTDSNFLQSAKSYIPEIPWNGSCGNELLASYYGYATTFGANGFCNSTYAKSRLYQVTIAAGGGPSKVYAKPSWQSAQGVPDDNKRGLPDVSLYAASGRWNHAFMACFSKSGLSCVSGNFYGSGGTSFTAPIMAGVQALINQRTGQRAGNPNPVYYSLARQQYSGPNQAGCQSSPSSSNANCIFHDVVTGDIVVNCTGSVNCYTAGAPVGVLSVSSTSYIPAYKAQTGWDFATGLGTIDVYNLVTKWPLTLPTP
jgi:subtilase family serine protease